MNTLMDFLGLAKITSTTTTTTTTTQPKYMQAYMMEAVDDQTYYKSFEFLGNGDCSNAKYELGHKKMNVKSFAECASYARNETLATGFSVKFVAEVNCKIFGPSLSASPYMLTPPWTVVPGPATRPEIPNKALGFKCYRKKFEWDGKTPVKYCIPSIPKGQARLWNPAVPCAEGVTIGNYGQCTVRCLKEYFPYPLVAKCIGGQMKQRCVDPEEHKAIRVSGVTGTAGWSFIVVQGVDFPKASSASWPKLSA